MAPRREVATATAAAMVVAAVVETGAATEAVAAVMVAVAAATGEVANAVDLVRIFRVSPWGPLCWLWSDACDRFAPSSQLLPPLRRCHLC